MDTTDQRASLLEAFLTRKQQRRRIRQTRAVEEERREKEQLLRDQKRSKSIRQLEEKFPDLKKTMQEVLSMDLRLPSDLFPDAEDSVAEKETSMSNRRTVLQNWSKNGLEYRMEGTAKREVARKLPLRMSNDGFVVKRGREKETGGDRKRTKETPSADEESIETGNETRKLQRRWVAVDAEKFRKSVPSALMSLYDAIVQSMGDIDRSGAIQVRLLVKRVLTAFNIEVTTDVFLVELIATNAQGDRSGCYVGYDEGLLYVHDFLKGTEDRTEAIFSRLDPTDPVTSSHRTNRRCYQWMQRMIRNKNGIRFTASDLYNVTPIVSVEDFVKAMTENT